MTVVRTRGGGSSGDGFPALALVLLVAVAAGGCGEPVGGGDGTAFDVMERSITELAAALDAGEVTSPELVAGYLARHRRLRSARADAERDGRRESERGRRGRPARRRARGGGGCAARCTGSPSS